MRKLRSAKGLTMISLVITIITVLILTGVVLNSVTGERSVIKKANEAKTKQEEAKLVEEMNLLLAGVNTEVMTGSYDKDADDITAIFEGEATSEEDFYKGITEIFQNQFDECIYFGEYYLIEHEGNYFKIKESTEQKGQYVVSEYLSPDLAKNESGGSYVVTVKNADDAGNLKFQPGSDYTVIDKISAEKFNFVIPNAHGNPANAVSLYLNEDMEINNIGYSRSAIELEEGAILNLYICSGAEVVVNSAYGEQGQAGGQKDENNKVKAADGGPGGYAGIHVPSTATLNVYGEGTLIAYGGDAGDGNTVQGSLGSGGGGGAGAGIGGNGGSGGDANTTEISNNAYNRNDNGLDGEAGEACGTINIYNTVKVYAYGGAGGSGGIASQSAGSGGGGYPAAGIGGGGAGGGGGNHCDGAGGYSGGGAQYNVTNGKNGLGGGLASKPNAQSSGGGGYFSCGYGRVNTNLGFAAIGGQGSGACHWVNNTTKVWWNDHAGSGGTGGAGGNVTVSSKAKVYAYNGDMITEGTHDGIYAYDQHGNKTSEKLEKVIKPNNQEIVPCQIFAQAGIKRDVYISNFSTAANYKELKNEIDNNYKTVIRATSYGYGIGSGAGYRESENGTYTVNKAYDDITIIKSK